MYARRLLRRRQVHARRGTDRHALRRDGGPHARRSRGRRTTCEQVHALQDAIKVEQKSAGKFEVPNWDPASQKKVRDALLVLGATLPDFKATFGTRNEVDPVRHLIGAAAAWGGNPDKDAIYLNVTPAENDGKTVYRLTVKDVPVDGFWSISVYNAEGYFEKNTENAYSLNNITAKKGDDGSITIQFGGCDGNIPNCLPIMPGWNYTVRLYRPRQEILTAHGSSRSRSRCREGDTNFTSPEARKSHLRPWASRCESRYSAKEYDKTLKIARAIVASTGRRS